MILKSVAQKAGIDKPINPHHFRHSRATDLAKKLTEAQLCQYMGWIQSSREAATYIHLSGRDMDKAILTLHGLAEEETEEEHSKKSNAPGVALKTTPVQNSAVDAALVWMRKVSWIMICRRRRQSGLACILWTY